MSDRQVFLLQRVQPAMTGLIDGSLSTLAPIFAVALATKEPHVAFYAGLATAIGAAISMAFSEGLSDTGEFTGRGNPVVRGAITGGGTFVGGILHTLPFLIPHYRIAIISAIVVVGFELVTLALGVAAIARAQVPEEPAPPPAPFARGTSLGGLAFGFGSGGGQTSFDFGASYGFNGFLLKYDFGGNRLWGRFHLGKPGYDAAYTSPRANPGSM